MPSWKPRLQVQDLGGKTAKAVLEKVVWCVKCCATDGIAMAAVRDALLGAGLLEEEAQLSDPVVWTGELGGEPARVRRLDEHALIAEKRDEAYSEDEACAWYATDDETAMRALEQALLQALGTRGTRLDGLGRTGTSPVQEALDAFLRDRTTDDLTVEWDYDSAEEARTWAASVGLQAFPATIPRGSVHLYAKDEASLLEALRTP